MSALAAPSPTTTAATATAEVVAAARALHATAARALHAAQATGLALDGARSPFETALVAVLAVAEGDSDAALGAAAVLIMDGESPPVALAQARAMFPDAPGDTYLYWRGRPRCGCGTCRPA